MNPKFRVWNKEFQEWEDITQFFIRADGALCRNDPPGYLIVDDGEYVVELWTGHIDESGKEIYEGDVVATTDGFLSKVAAEFTTYDAAEVKWLREGFHLCQSMIGASPFCKYVTCDCHPAQLRILYNIHQISF